MNDDRQIAADSRHSFHFLPHFNLKTAGAGLMITKFGVNGSKFTKFVHDVEG